MIGVLRSLYSYNTCLWFWRLFSMCVVSIQECNFSFYEDKKVVVGIIVVAKPHPERVSSNGSTRF